MSDPSRDEEYRPPRVERLALQFLSYCDEIEPVVAAREPELFSHVKEAAASILANVGEALDEPSPGDRRRFFRYAMRSAGESERLLRGLRTIGTLDDARFMRGRRILLDVKWDLRRLLARKK